VKRIRKGALGAVLISAGTILAFLGMVSPARPASRSTDVTSSSTTMTTSEDAYCAKGDIWTGATSDGPAHLPHGCVYTGLDGSPSPGKVIALAAGGDVISTVKAASCGDTIQLQAGASFTLNGGPIFPSKNCDSKHWITIRTSAANSALPPEHTRINPSYAGVASLSGRPAFSGPNKNVMAKLVVSGSNSIQIGDHYRLIGLEITRPNDGKWYNALVGFTGSHIILDRNWIHGDPTADTTHLVQTQPGADHVAIINSYMTDAHCKASPVNCSDAQDWSDGGHGTFMKAYNNFMEASGQSIMFGGAAAVIITSDVEIRLNHMFKPLTWNPLDKKFIGTKFTVKNNFELKEGQRILVEGNIMENTWGGFTQKGANILLTPKNQSGSNGRNLCPICFVSDVTLRYNYVRHGAQGMQIANGQGDNGGWSLGGHNYSIHDLVFDGMQYSECYQCANFLNDVSSSYKSDAPPPTAEVMHDVTLNHVTIVNTGFLATGKTATGFMEMNGPPAGNKTATPRIDNFEWTNSIGDAGTSGAYPTGGGSDNCAVGEKTVADMVTACWTGASSFTANLLVTDHALSTLVFPSGNSTTSAWSKVGFVNFNGGDGGDYHLQPSSQYHDAGTDGRDLGADIDSVDSAKKFAE
jgi:hypothetical protein